VDCKETQELLSGYFDHELDLMRSVEVENHLQECVACSEKLKVYQELSNTAGDPSLYYKAPANLRNQVLANLRQTKTIAYAPKTTVKKLSWFALAASLAFVFLLGWIIGRSQPLRLNTEAELHQQIFASHVRSLMPGHLTDVVSSDQHTVKPWFNGKVDLSPPVRDFATEGFPLIGGRLDYINHKMVPVLVYQKNKHIINVFLSAAAETTDKKPETTMLQGYNIIEWTRSGISYYVVSDLNETELQNFVKLLNS